MCDLKKEYLEFGPWLTMIEKEEDVPVQFDHVKKEILNSEFAFKMPVNMEWKEAQEGMLLYNQIITLTQSGVCSHIRLDGAVFTTQMDFEDIAFIELSVNMLYSRVSLATVTETLNIDYNPVSQGIIETLIGSIRQHYTANTMGINLDAVQEVGGIESDIYKYLVAHERQFKPTKAIALQAYYPLGNKANSEGGSHLQDAVVMATKNEFIFFNRVKEIKEKKEVDYGYNCTFMPMSTVKDGQISEAAISDELKRIVIEKGQAKFEMTVDQGFKVDSVTDVMMVCN